MRPRGRTCKPLAGACARTATADTYVTVPERSRFWTGLGQRCQATALASGVRMSHTRLVRGGLGSLLAVMCAALSLVIGSCIRPHYHRQLCQFTSDIAGIDQSIRVEGN